MARERLDGWLTALVDQPVADDARLGASELVTNVVRHSGLGVSDSLLLTADAADGRVRVEVEQNCSAAGAHLVRDGELAGGGGGFGLRIVDVMATVWGVEDGPPGRVWFEVGPGP